MLSATIKTCIKWQCVEFSACYKLIFFILRKQGRKRKKNDKRGLEECPKYGEHFQETDVTRREKS